LIKKIFSSFKNSKPYEDGSVKGQSAFLIRDITGEYLIRIYDKDYNFVDYEIWHSDLQIKIEDADAFKYTNPNGVQCIDYNRDL
jgi:hypothetical protein